MGRGATALEASPVGGATSDQRLVTALRQMIMDGRLSAGSKISEVQISDRFGVSRTPARLALRALEVEGLIQKREGRGYTVLTFNADDLAKAYEVRGVLEGLAAGTLARQGLPDAVMAHLMATLDQIDDILNGDGPIDQSVIAYQEANIDFHETIMGECGNAFVGFAFARLQHMPLLGLGTVIFNEDRAANERLRLQFANMQHRVILDAIERRDAFRAETLMREHANQIPVYTELLVQGRTAGE